MYELRSPVLPVSGYFGLTLHTPVTALVGLMRNAAWARRYSMRRACSITQNRAKERGASRSSMSVFARATTRLHNDHARIANTFTSEMQHLKQIPIKRLAF